MIGSHNSMSYLPARRRWMRLLTWTARCQRQALAAQYMMGMECLDIRVRFKKDGTVVAAHGPVEFEGDVHDAINDVLLAASCLKRKGEREQVTFRLVLETSGNEPEDVADFRAFAEWLTALGASYEVPVTIVCGRRKGDWARLLDCGEPATEQHVGSMRAWYGKVWPWLWWRLHRGGEATAMTDEPGSIHLYDFVGCV